MLPTLFRSTVSDVSDKGKIRKVPQRVSNVKMVCEIFYICTLLLFTQCFFTSNLTYSSQEPHEVARQRKLPFIEEASVARRGQRT